MTERSAATRVAQTITHAATHNNMSPQRDVTLLVRRRVLPLVSYIAHASVTNDDRRQRLLLICPYTMCRRASNRPTNSPAELWWNLALEYKVFLNADY